MFLLVVFLYATKLDCFSLGRHDKINCKNVPNFFNLISGLIKVTCNANVVIFISFSVDKLIYFSFIADTICK